MKSSFVLLLLLACSKCDTTNNEIDSCSLPDLLKREIAAYRPTVTKIIFDVLEGRFKGTTYGNLTELVDTFGSRQSGTRNLENAIDYMLKKSVENNLENVHGEEFLVPHWIRGNESASMIKPRYQNIPMLGLGSSIGTPPEGLQAEVVVVESFDDLAKKSHKIKGKIVVYNQKYVSYGKTAKYRSHGADEASKFGAVATLIRSITPFSLATPHTGWQDYSGEAPKIPTACITIEDAEMLHRRYLRGEKITIEIKMRAQNLPETKTRNTIAEISGRTYPEAAVLVSGHLDSWDVGEGAMDDGAGAIMGWNALAILKEIGLRPKRTLRVVLWSGEEEGLVGAFAYAEKHKNENIMFAMESDEGTFTPQGINYAGEEYGGCVLQEILKLFDSINATQLIRSADVGSDIMVLIGNGIPGASLINKNEKYFWYHHSAADKLTVEDSDTLDHCTALWAGVAYVISDLSYNFTRHESKGVGLF